MGHILPAGVLSFNLAQRLSSEFSGNSCSDFRRNAVPELRLRDEVPCRPAERTDPNTPCVQWQEVTACYQLRTALLLPLPPGTTPRRPSFRHHHELLRK